MEDAEDFTKPPQPPKAPGNKPEPRPPVPPPAALLKEGESPLMGYMRQRMELMERELIKERERAIGSEKVLQQQESLRGEVEDQLKKLSDQLKQEKMIQELETDKSASHGRVDALEKRLDEMHKTWAGLLETAVSRKEHDVGLAGPEAQSIVENLVAMRREMANFKDTLAGIPEMVPDIAQLRNMVPADQRRRAEEEKALREHLQGMVDRMAESLVERLGGLDRRLAQELGTHRERIEALARERDSLREAVDEQRHNVRQEYLKEHNALEVGLQQKLEELRAPIEEIAKAQSGSGGALDAIEQVTKQLHAILTRPAAVKDQMLLDVEQEKKDLLRALKERTEQLRSYTLERREVEHTLGESLMDLNRQLEAERAKDRQRKEHIASLESTIEALKADDTLKVKEAEQQQNRFTQLAAERDKIIEALTLEAEKVRKQVEARMESDRRWEEKVLDFQKLLNDESEKRLQAEHTASDLRAQIQTLSNHITSVIRDKESAEQEQVEWQTKKQETQESLRKKDEMIAMLSATFQNLLKKPNP
jgi:chromosome segregation ATPase